MKGSWKWVLQVALLGVTAFGMIAVGLQAGPPPAGHFKLPFDVQFGAMKLPSGDYTILNESLTAKGNIVVYHEGRAVGMVLPQVFEGHENQSTKPVLVCIRHDGNVTVRALRLPNVGTYYFSLPKELKTLVAQEPHLIETISVEVSAD